ncbi:MAG TPA: DUF4258 domain-containing protein [Alphaproteobacteria bacterium]|nr:DUF4258 domain-containing protein [Alphaproteobacteria bacterium]
MNYSLTEHAKKMLVEREIALEWLERVLNNPLLRESDPDDASLERWYRPMPECEGRVLRVVVNITVDPVRVVSVFFDRSMKGRL